MSLAKMGKPCSVETRDKLRRANIGKHLTPEIKDKIHQATIRRQREQLEEFITPDI
jgi:hypothetical protein